MLAISSWRTIVVRPSEQKRMRSPGCSSIGYTSTSTARWPPMPSATATRPRRLAWSRKSSSLPSRTRPTSVTPAATSLKGLTACSHPPGCSLDDLRDGLAELHLVAALEPRHALDLVAVHVGAVGRAEVLDVSLAV